MPWQTIAQGDSKSIPNIALDPAKTYRLTIAAPINLPSWMAGSIQGALGTLGLASTVTISGNEVAIIFGKSDRGAGGSGGGGGGAR